MRAATLIVGAIAVASCLIAAALVLRDTGPTKRVVVHDRTTAAEAQIEEQFEREAEVAQSGTPTACNDSVSAGPDTSCGLALNVWKAYHGGDGEVTAVSPLNGSSYRFHCTGTAPTICTGSRGATVYIAPQP